MWCRFNAALHSRPTEQLGLVYLCDNMYGIAGNSVRALV
ncbi:hypothetical protein LCGC14_1654960 [marine sediment metagenome]|uniref:Uncharacterized protein n=1 Tax=marine sediment metagenome TaxID=412755 RepID=A0A0F9KBQ5_9ZZZZ